MQNALLVKKLGLDTYQKQMVFLLNIQNQPSEDMAEVFSHLIR